MNIRTISASVAALAFVLSSGIAQADSAHNRSTYTFTNGGNYNSANPPAGQTPTATEYHEAIYGSADNTDTASSTVTNTFTLKGSVSKDCSYYGGGSTAHTLDLGTIGVKTDNNQIVSDAFNQNGSNQMEVDSYTAGCNTNNTVTISKGNGSTGLLNAATSGFDSDQFTNAIQYKVEADFTGTTNTGAGEAGKAQKITADLNDASKVWTGGAWRSHFILGFTIPAPTKGLVAGDYSDTVTVTLAAQ